MPLRVQLVLKYFVLSDELLIFRFDFFKPQSNPLDQSDHLLSRSLLCIAQGIQDSGHLFHDTGGDTVVSPIGLLRRDNIFVFLFAVVFVFEFYRRFGSVVVVVVAAVIVIVIVDVVGVLIVMMAQDIAGVSIAVVFSGRRQRDVRLKTPAELFGLRVRYDFLWVH